MVKQIAIAIIATVASLLAGCATPGLPNGYEVDISSDFSAEEVSAIETGFQSWTALSKGAPTFDFKVVSPSQLPDDGSVPWSTIAVRKASPDFIKSECHTPDVSMCTAIHGTLAHDEDGQFNLLLGSTGATSYMPPIETVTTDGSLLYSEEAAHEAGHAMGVSHDTKTGNVMYRVAQVLPTCEDLQRYAAERPRLDVSDCK